MRSLQSGFARVGVLFVLLLLGVAMSIGGCGSGGGYDYCCYYDDFGFYDCYCKPGVPITPLDKPSIAPPEGTHPEWDDELGTWIAIPGPDPDDMTFDELLEAGYDPFPS